MNAPGTEAKLQEFLDSLPAAYRERYSAEEIAAHYATSRARGEMPRKPPAWVGLTPSAPGTLGVCIVADDRRGLFSSITSALRLRKLDIVSAEAYCRLDADTAEVVDVFRLRHAGDNDTEKRSPTDTVASICHTLLGLLGGNIDPHQSLPPSRRGPEPEVVDTRVRFLEDDSGTLAVLEVETDDRSGLLQSLADALHRQDVDIVRSEVVTVGQRVQDRFVLEASGGGPIESSQRLDIQVAVLSAIQFAF